jgi:uncharacterized protein YndB with AHSA1/START domain
MAETADAPTKTAERKLVITRILDAPRELVWKAWTAREHVLKWLGPRQFTALDFELDPRPGGAWHSRMRGPDGAEYSNGGTVREAEEPKRLVFTFAWDEEDGTPGREMEITITFDERDGKTEMTFQQAEFESVEDRDGHRVGWSESFDKLAEYLARI